MTSRISCIIIDNDIKARNRIKQLLIQFEYIEVLSCESEPEIAIQNVNLQKPDIVFIGIEIPRINGFNVIKSIRQNNCYPTFIVVTSHTQYAIKAIKHDVFDYLLKPIDIEELTITIERYKKATPHRTHTKLMNIPLLSCLTNREKEVLKLAIEGNTSRKTADILYIGKTTVDSHRRKILEKTGAKKISELMITLFISLQ